MEPELRDVAQRVATALRAELPIEVRRRHEALLLHRLAAREIGGRDLDTPSVSRLRPRRTARRVGVLALAAAMVLGTSAVAFADGAVPGDVLYPVDRALERLELVRAGSPAREAGIHLRHASERLDEAGVLEETGGDVTGPIGDAIDSGDEAQDAAQRANDAAVADRVSEALQRHVTRMMALRDRLEADGHANERALAALDRVIARAAERAERGPGRPSDTGPPSETGRPESPGRSEEHRPPDAGQPVEPGRPAGAGQQGGSSGGGGGGGGQPEEPGPPVTPGSQGNSGSGGGTQADPGPPAGAPGAGNARGGSNAP
jgi:uncharacterized membrane protein YgcG